MTTRDTLTDPRAARGTVPSDGGLPDVGPLPRLDRLRAALLDAPYALCTQKAELLTRYFRSEAPRHPLERLLAPLHYALTRRGLERTLGSGTPQPRWQVRASNALQRLYTRLQRRADRLPPVLRYAHALGYVLDHVPLRIYADELLVGDLSGPRIGAPIHPDFGGLLLLPELDRLGARAVNPLQTTPEQVRALRDEVFPFWFTRSVMAKAPALADDPELGNTLMAGTPFILTQFAGISHVTPDYGAVLAHGFAGLAERADRLRAGTTDPARAAFYDAARVVAQAAIRFGERWHDRCLAEAEDCTDPARAAELRELAEMFARVPARPARTFHEALQSLVITHAIVHQESFQHGVSFGRIDQYLYPYYRADVEAERLTPARAVELLGCFLGKAAELLPLFNSMATEYFSGLSSASGITLGGTDALGRDATNELSGLVLLAHDRMRLRQPNLHVRVHPDSPAWFLGLAHEVVKRGGGMPAFFNDATVVPAIEHAGVPEGDARDYSIVGCVEWGVPGKSFPAAGAGFLSLPAVLDRVLHQATPHGHRVEPIAFSSMNNLLTALQRELRRVVAAAARGNDAIERAHAQYRPTPLLSLLVDGCLDAGRDVNAGGALYNSTGFQGVGLADVADSLAALDQLVFGERRLSLAELVAALDADFQGHEPLRQRLLNKVARYGEDEGLAERYAREVAVLYAALVRAQPHPRGGRYQAGFWTMTTHVGFGARLGALPSGRRAGQPLSDGVSPVNGGDRRGPTASLMAAARATGPFVANGCALNEKLDPWFVQGEPGTALMVGLTRGYFAGGGMQVQYNVLDPQVLLDAKAHPERHRDLVVRISGYSAYFCDLTPAMQDDVIARTLHGASAMPACLTPAGVGA